MGVFREEPVPILLVILDGMADRPYSVLGGRTPLEAASTPVMDRLTLEGQSGFYYPLGPGRVPSTELSHFRLFGYDGYRFPGRACLEALGHDVPCTPNDTFSFLALRRVVRRAAGGFCVVGGYGEAFEDAPAGYAKLNVWEDGPTGYRFEVFPLPKGEAVIRILQGNAPMAPCGEVTDSDPFFFTALPVLRPRPTTSASRPEAAAQTADALVRFLGEAAETFGAPRSGRLVVSKWTGTYEDLPAFEELAGLTGTIVASTRVMRGLARLIGLGFIRSGLSAALVDTGLKSPAEDIAGKLERSLALLSSGEAGFAHAHAKAADDASHTGDPTSKVAVVEELDRGLEALLEVPQDRLVLCVTSDHCTPVGGRTVHWGDSVPLLVRGPHVRVDGASSFDERSATRGGLGQLGAPDLLPYLLCHADRAHFLGARPIPTTPLGVPSTGEPWFYRGAPQTETPRDA
jgi:2,3-bisphosphoglycerate-independent phosphoglycerate mutase